MKNYILRSINKNRHLRLFLSLYSVSKLFLQDSGWKKSIHLKMPVDKVGAPIPWFTYSAISFLESRITRSHKIFEYGSGNSTIWFSKLAQSVFSCEHDGVWYNLLQKKTNNIPNLTYILRQDLKNDYINEITNYTEMFDIVIIDGRNRVECAKRSLIALKENGVIVWDNSDRTKYQKGYDFLSEQGFKRIDFSGMGPINPSKWTTSIFYRENNCLAI